MEIRCRICGSLKDIAPLHKDFKVVKENPNFPFICELCGRKIQFEMQKANDIYKSAHNSSQALDENTKTSPG